MMKKQINSLIYSFLVMGVLLIFAGSCKKEDNNNNTNSANTFTDPRDGNVYDTVTIGTQTWMAENLRYLPSVAGPGTGSFTTPYYYVYHNVGTNVQEAKANINYFNYGVLYNWTAAISACPSGWHLPSDAEWTQLIDYLGGDGTAGGKLKEAGTSHWNSPNTGATNETGFTALPGAYRHLDGKFYDFGSFGYWWSATEYGTSEAWLRCIHYSYSDVFRYNLDKQLGLSVRCVKD